MKVERPHKGFQTNRLVKVINIGKAGNITVIEIDGVKYSFLKDGSEK